jgi:sulfane dehydrogenase subunit SoxC
MTSKKIHQYSEEPGRRRFLKRGAALAGLTVMGGTQSARGQYFQNLAAFVPEESVPSTHLWRDPWTGEPLRDTEGNLVVDWTGTPEWETHRRTVRALGGPRYGTREKDYRLYGYRSRFVTSHRLATNGGGANEPTAVETHFFSLLSPLQDQVGIITPNDLHFVDEHGPVPEVDPRAHSLTIFGMVDRPVTFTIEDLLRLPSVSRVHFVECNSNGTPGHPARRAPWATPGDIYGELSCAEYTGVLLSTLLERVGVQRGASWFWAQSDDQFNHSASLPLAKAMDDAIIAYGQNGEPLRPEQGFPVRLLVPGFQGTNNIKRLGKIKVTNEPATFHREATNYTWPGPDNRIRWFRFEMPPMSCILRPCTSHPIPSRGFYEIRGIAWSGHGKVRRVEITTDGGRTWKDAQVQGPVHSKALTRFVFPWLWDGEEMTIASRCTDDVGSTQPTTAEFSEYTGVGLNDFSHRIFPRMNVIQPWKIARDGTVTNAIFSI